MVLRLRYRSGEVIFKWGWSVDLPPTGTRHLFGACACPCTCTFQRVSASHCLHLSLPLPFSQLSLSQAPRALIWYLLFFSFSCLVRTVCWWCIAPAEMYFSSPLLEWVSQNSGIPREFLPWELFFLRLAYVAPLGACLLSFSCAVPDLLGSLFLILPWMMQDSFRWINYIMGQLTLDVSTNGSWCCRKVEFLVSRRCMTHRSLWVAPYNAVLSWGSGPTWPCIAGLKVLRLRCPQGCSWQCSEASCSLRLKSHMCHHWCCLDPLLTFFFFLRGERDWLCLVYTRPGSGVNSWLFSGDHMGWWDWTQVGCIGHKQGEQPTHCAVSLALLAFYGEEPFAL